MGTNSTALSAALGIGVLFLLAIVAMWANAQLGGA
jgi:hypothetical protein